MALRNFKQLCRLYCLFFVMTGICLSVADAITTDPISANYFYEIFLLYTYLGANGAFLFLIVQYVKIRKVEDMLKLLKEDNESPRSGFKRDSLSSYLEEMRDKKLSYMAEEGAGHFLKFGAVLFAAGTIVKGCVLFAAYSKVEGACTDPITFVVTVLSISFVVIQTYWIVVNSKLVMLVNKHILRLCYLHIIGANLIMWVDTSVRETQLDLFEKSIAAGGGVTPSHTATWVECYSEDSLTRSTAQYLFPWPIEFALIGAAVFFNCYRNCSMKPPGSDKKSEDAQPGSSDTNEAVRQSKQTLTAHEPPKFGWCHRSWLGVTAGVPASIGTIVVVGFFKQLIDKQDDSDGALAMVLFYSLEIILLALATAAVVYGYFQVSRKLGHVSSKPGDFNIDVPLLIISLAGVYAQWMFVMIAFFVSLSDGHEAANQGYNAMQVVESLLYILQVTLQTVFILDTFKRAPVHEQHVLKKPGRSALIFLSILNLLMWFVNIFILDKENETAIVRSAYNDLAWAIISHICVPMLIFYRFHSAACLADIWYNAYEVGTHIPLQASCAEDNTTEDGSRPEGDDKRRNRKYVTENGEDSRKGGGFEDGKRGGGSGGFGIGKQAGRHDGLENESSNVSHREMDIEAIGASENTDYIVRSPAPAKTLPSYSSVSQSPGSKTTQV